MDFSDVLVSGASPSAPKRLKFSESALIMHFDADKKNQSNQITLSSVINIIKSDKMII